MKSMPKPQTNKTYIIVPSSFTPLKLDMSGSGFWPVSPAENRKKNVVCQHVRHKSTH